MDPRCILLPLVSILKQFNQPTFPYTDLTVMYSLVLQTLCTFYMLRCCSFYCALSVEETIGDRMAD
jgi:hypothetical protein